MNEAFSSDMIPEDTPKVPALLNPQAPLASTQPQGLMSPPQEAPPAPLAPTTFSSDMMPESQFKVQTANKFLRDYVAGKVDPSLFSDEYLTGMVKQANLDPDTGQPTTPSERLRNTFTDIMGMNKDQVNSIFTNIGSELKDWGKKYISEIEPHDHDNVLQEAYQVARNLPGATWNAIGGGVGGTSQFVGDFMLSGGTKLANLFSEDNPFLKNYNPDAALAWEIKNRAEMHNAFKAGESTLGIDSNSASYALGSNIGPLFLPVGAASASGKGIAKAAEEITEQTPRVAGGLMKGVGNIVENPVAQAVAATATGHPHIGLGILGEALAEKAAPNTGGGLIGQLLTGAKNIRQKIVGATTSAMKNIGDVLLNTPRGMTMAEGFATSAENQIKNLQSAVDKIIGDKPEAGDAILKNPDGTWQMPLDTLTKEGQQVRTIANQMAGLQGKANTFKGLIDTNKVLSSTAKGAIATGLTGVQGAAILGTINGATALPGDQDAVNGGAVLGAVLGIGGGLAPELVGRPGGVRQGFLSLRQQQGNDAMIARGKPLVDPAQLDGLSDDAKNYVYKMAGAHDAMDKRLEILDDLAMRQMGNTPKGVDTPFGFIDPNNTTSYINKGALGAAAHELAHHSQEFFGQYLRHHDPVLADAFDKYYSQRAGGAAFDSEKERDAEIGRILLEKMPIEMFYGGKTGGDVLNQLGRGITDRFGLTKIDPVLRAYYSPTDITAMRERMFQLGEEAAKPGAPPPPPRGGIPNVVASAPGPIPIIAPGVPGAAKAGVVPPAPITARPQDFQIVIDAMKKLGYDNATANARVQAAIEDLNQTGQPINLENVGRGALQKGVPDVTEVGQPAQASPVEMPAAEPPRGIVGRYQLMPGAEESKEARKAWENYGDMIYRQRQSGQYSQEDMDKAYKHASDLTAAAQAAGSVAPETAGRQFMPATLNVGLDVGDTKNALKPEDVINHLNGMGVNVDRQSVHPGEENTLVATLNRPLTKEEGEKLAGLTKQSAIPQWAGGKGEMFGSGNPEHPEWNEFNPEYFLNHQGMPLKGGGPELSSSIWDSIPMDASGRKEAIAEQIGVPPDKRYFEQTAADQKKIADYFTGKGEAKFMPASDYAPPYGAPDKWNQETPDQKGFIARMRGIPEAAEKNYEDLSPEQQKEVQGWYAPYVDRGQHEPARMNEGDFDTAYLAQQAYGEHGEHQSLGPDFKFMPSGHPDAIKEAAIRFENGDVYTGFVHALALSRARNAGHNPDLAEEGFIDNNGKFYNRADAYQQALKMDQNPYPASWQLKGEERKLEAYGFGKEPEGENNVQFMPASKSKTWDQIAANLDPEELAQVSERYREKIVDAFKPLSMEKGIQYAQKGASGRYWYRDAVNAIHALFASDIPEQRSDPDRFAALLAALSPNRAVSIDLTHSLRAWAEWEKQGRPQDRATIEDIIASTNVNLSGKEQSAFPAYIQNAFRALTVDDPSALKLSGPKVDPFFANLRGDVNKVTNDRHMGMYGYQSIQLGHRDLQREGEPKGVTRQIQAAKGLALTAHIRQVASKLSEISGETWTPSEVQAAIWTYQIPLQDVAKAMGTTPTELLSKGYELPEKELAKVPSLVNLLQSEINQSALQSIRRSRGTNPVPEIGQGAGLSTKGRASAPEATAGIPNPF